MSATFANMPEISQDPSEDTFVQNPYRLYQRMRASGDLVFWKEFDVPMAVTQEAVRQVMRHPQMGRAVPEMSRPQISETLEPFYDVERYSLLELEPPEHTRIRRVVAKGFALQRMAPLAPMISQTADQLIDRFPDGPFDLIETFSQRLTALSIAMFLGIEPRHASLMQGWSEAMVAMYQARRDASIDQNAARAATEFAAFINDEINRRSQFPTNDFLSELVAAEASGEITRAEVISTAILLLNAGQEATAHAIGNALMLLATFPERALALHPEHMANTVEECLRHTPPLHIFMRHVYSDIRLFDFDIPAGSQIGCLLGSACRDDAIWPDGEKFDPFRMRHNHQAFGVGIHACTGAALARLEMQIALPVLFGRCPKLNISEPPRVANRYHFHGLERLIVTVK